MWLCCPSTFKPAVGPRVESDAGEPASPNAPAVPINAMVAKGLKPSSKASGTKIAAIIGIVAKDDPIPIVTNNPITNMINTAKLTLPASRPAEASTKLST